MASFLLLFLVCALGAFVATSLVWVIFWIVGILETPAWVLNRLVLLSLGQRVRQYQETSLGPAVGLLKMQFDRQAGTAAFPMSVAVTLLTASPGLNSASQSFPPVNILL